MLRKTAICGHFGRIRPFPVAESGPKMSKGTSTGHDLSYEPIPRSLRPFVLKKQPGKAYVSKNRFFGHFGQIRPFPVTESDQNCQKGTSTRQDISYEPSCRSLRPSVTKKQPEKAHV